MITAEILLNVLTPEEINSLGTGKLRQIQILGKQNHYRLISANCEYRSIYICDNKYALKRAKELTLGHITKNLTPQEKNLFISEVRFVDDNKMIELLKFYNITKEEMEQLNLSISIFKNAHLEFQKALTYFEKKYGIKYDQVVKINSELYPLLQSLNYPFNEEDIILYNNARLFYTVISRYAMNRKKSFMEVVNNPFLTKFSKFSKNVFDFDQNSIYILINKINKILVTNLELFESMPQNHPQKKV